MNPDEAIQNLKVMIAQLKEDEKSDDFNSLAQDTFEYYANKLEFNLKILEAAIIELKDKNEYWDRVRVKKDRTSDLAGLAEWLHNG